MCVCVCVCVLSAKADLLFEIMIQLEIGQEIALFSKLESFKCLAQLKCCYGIPLFGWVMITDENENLRELVRILERQLKTSHILPPRNNSAFLDIIRKYHEKDFLFCFKILVIRRATQYI